MSPVFKELQKLVEAFAFSVKVILTCFILIVMILWFCGMVARYQIGKKYYDVYMPYQRMAAWDMRAYFGSVHYSMFTMAVIATRQESFEEVVRHVADQQPMTAAMLFTPFIIITTLGLLNIILAVIVAHVIKNAKVREGKAEVEAHIRRVEAMETIRYAFIEADTNYDGELTLEEFNDLINSRPDLVAMHQSQSQHRILKRI